MPETKKPKAIYHLARAICRRSIRIDYPGGNYDNATREYMDEVLYDLDQESDLASQIREHHEHRQQICSMNEIELQSWRAFEKGLPMGEDFKTADQVQAKAPPAQTAQQQGQAQPGQARPQSGGNGGRPPSEKQINFLLQLFGRSSWAEKYLLGQLEMRGKKIEQIREFQLGDVKIWIDNMIAEEKKERDAQQ